MNLDATLADDQPASIGRYRILSELGRGSMARVYLAQDPVVDRKVALKVISPTGPVDAVTWQTLRTRFLLEARAAGKLHHPHAVAIYDADTDEESGLSYIAMEWVDGRSLDKLLSTRGPLPTETTSSIIQQVAGALDAAHSQGLIHRDVKPGNILIGNDAQAKLSDFGIVKFEDLRLTSTGGVVGTPLYMSPEQIRGEDLDGRSDLFSLGVVLYQCLTGATPFSADSVAGLTHQILHLDPEAPHWSNPSIPEGLSATVLQTLSKDPEARPQTGAELSRQISQVVPTAATSDPAVPSVELTSTLPMSHTELEGVLSGDRTSSKAPTLLFIGFVVLALLAVAALFLDKTTKKTSMPASGVARPNAELPAGATQPEPTPPQSDRSWPGQTSPYPTGSVASENRESTSPPHQRPNDRTSQSPTQSPPPAQAEDDWIDKTEEIIDDAERIYRVSVGKTKRWWDRHARKKGGNGKANGKEGARDEKKKNQ